MKKCLSSVAPSPTLCLLKRQILEKRNGTLNIPIMNQLAIVLLIHYKSGKHYFFISINIVLLT